jgi:hypothetical protein
MKTIRILIILVVLLSIIVMPTSSQVILSSSKVIVMRDIDNSLYHTVCVINCNEFHLIMGASSNVSIDGFTDELLAMEDYLQKRADYYGMAFVPIPSVLGQ